MLQRIKKGWLSRLSRAHGYVKIVEPWGILLAVVALFLTVGQFWLEFDERVEERRVRAWQLVTTIAPGNSGKIEALEYLNSEDGLFCFEFLKGNLEWLHDDKYTKCLILFKSRVPLVGINLSRSANVAEDDSSTNLSGVFLAGVDLREAILLEARLIGANLIGANLIGANLITANLSGANLSSADLRGADLIGANLRGADLIGADLSGANLNGANLITADMRGVNLSGTNLRAADLSGANLIGANLIGADLITANLSGANLSGTNLRYANLSDADLGGADLSGAILRYADLSGAQNLNSSQFENNCGNSSTKLPKGLTIKFCE